MRLGWYATVHMLACHVCTFFFFQKYVLTIFHRNLMTNINRRSMLPNLVTSNHCFVTEIQWQFDVNLAPNFVMKIFLWQFVTILPLNFIRCETFCRWIFIDKHGGKHPFATEIEPFVTNNFGVKRSFFNWWISQFSYRFCRFYKIISFGGSTKTRNQNIAKYTKKLYTYNS